MPAPSEPLCEVDDLKVHFPLRGSAAWLRTLKDGKPPVVRAVDGVSIGIEAGKTLGLVGESGCGKSTVARALVRLVRPTAGRIRFEGAELTGLSDQDFNAVRPHLQMVFQDPAASLNPRLSVRRMVEEPLKLHSALGAAERKARGPRRCWRKSASDASLPTAIRTNFRAVSARGSISPARWSPTRG